MSSPLRTAILFGALTTLAGSLSAQQERRPAGAVIGGVVRDATTTIVVPGASVRVEGTDLGAVSDSSGRYRISGVPPGPQRLLARRIGYAATRLLVVVPASGTITQNVVLAESALRLQEVTVTADPGGRARGEMGTASVIDREAIANQTATSLQGVLELLPGVPLTAPGLDNVQQIPLRNVPTSSSASLVSGGPSAADLASFGTLIILDGVPLSNNANLQTTGPRSELQFLIPSSAGGGIDLRRIPAATIERVEVIRGIPSARYGDLTQGVIVVDTRAGTADPTLMAHYDPRTSEGSIVAGRSFGARHTATLTTDLAHTSRSPGLRRDDTYRFSAQVAHRATAGRVLETQSGDSSRRLTFDSRLDFFQVYEDNPERPDVLPGRASWNRDRGFRASERARLNLSERSRIELTGSLDLTRQRSFVQSNRIRGALPFTNRITEGRQTGKFIGGEYLSRLFLEGDPRLIYTRLEGTTARSLFGFEHRARAGLELRREWNDGPGYSFDIEFPPQVTFNGVNGFDRPRRFDDVPPVATSALYLDDRLLRVLPGNVTLELQAGLRADALHDLTHWLSATRDVVLQPRLNMEIAPRSWLRLRGGVGRTAKLPTLGSLYPPPQFYDVVNVNWFTNNPAERLAVLSTFIRDPFNPDLRFSIGRKAEAGIEIAHARSGTTISLVAFNDRTRGAVGFRPELGFLLREHFDFVDSTQGTGRPPSIIEPASFSDTVPILTERPANNLALSSSGYELTATLPPIPWTRTHVEVTGALVRTKLEAPDIDFGRGFSNFQLDGRIPRTPYWDGVTRTGERGLLTYRIIHHQPQLGLVVTAAVQHTFKETSRDIGGTDSLSFAGYTTRSGQLVAVPAAERTDPQYADLRQPRIGIFIQPFGIRADWLLSVQVAKTLPLGGRLSFYAFNALDRPGRYDEGGFNSRQFPPLRFGAELTMPLAWITELGANGK
ncbi:MAG: TonB-dependent receptor domain-containing protein [Gemmatimonadaceae bacterium]